MKNKFIQLFLIALLTIFPSQFVKAATSNENIATTQAIMNLILNDDIGFTVTDISKKVFADISHTRIYAFLNNGTGRYFDTADGNTEAPFNWQIKANGQLALTDPNNNNVTLISLTKKDENIYAVSIAEPNETFNSTWNLSKPLTISDLDGKSLDIDVSNNPKNCTSVIASFLGNRMTINETCPGGNSTSTGTVSSVSDLDNLLHVIWDNNDGDAEFGLFDGTLTQGLLGFVGHTEGGVLDDISLDTFSELPSIPFTIDHLTEQVFTHQESGMVLVFFANGSGIESNDGDGSSNQPYENTFEWSITNTPNPGTLVVDYTSTNEEIVTVTLLSKSGNDFNVLAADDEGPENIDLRRTNQLSTALLNGKTLNLDTTNDPDCSSSIIYITGNRITVNEVCTGGDFSGTGTITNRTDLKKVVHIEWDGLNGSSEIGLVSGTVSNGIFIIVSHTESEDIIDVSFIPFQESL